MIYRFQSIPRITALAVCAAVLLGCVPTPYGPVPAIYPNTRNEYMFYQMNSVADLPTGESIDIGTLCWQGVEREVKNPGSYCSPYTSAIFLRKGATWRPLSDNPRLGSPDGATLIPANFHSGAAPWTFLFVQSSSGSDSGKLVINLMGSTPRQIRKMTLRAPVPSCGISSRYNKGPPYAYMAVVLNGNKLYALLHLFNVNKQACSPDEIYPFVIGSEKLNVQAAVYIGDISADGAMLHATRNRQMVAEHPDQWAYFDGTLPGELIPGLIQKPELTQVYGSVPCHPGAVTSLGFACWSARTWKPTMVRCSYSGTRIDTAFGRGSTTPPHTEFKGCEIVR